MIEVKVEMHR